MGKKTFHRKIYSKMLKSEGPILYLPVYMSPFL